MEIFFNCLCIFPENMDALSTSEAKILDLQSTGFEFVPTKMKQTLYSNRIESGLEKTTDTSLIKVRLCTTLPRDAGGVLCASSVSVHGLEFKNR